MNGTDKFVVMLSVILLAAFNMSIGCKPPDIKLTKWDIVMTSPSGQQDTYTVESVAKPKLDLEWKGGHTTAIDPGCIVMHDWERDIVAPAGWRLEVKPHTQGQPDAKAEIDY